MEIDKCITHIKWILNALKEHNKIIKQDIKNKVSDNIFAHNRCYMSFYMGFFTYCKLVNIFDKSFNTMIASNSLNYVNLNRTCNVYFNRICVVFKDAGNQLKKAKQEMYTLSNSFILVYNEMKQISALISVFQKDLVIVNNFFH